MIKKLLGIGVVVVVVLGAGLWWFVLRDDPPAELGVDSGSGDTSAQTTTGTAPANLDGTWTIGDGGDTTAGFRMQESFASGLADHTAVGRTGDVTGSLTLDGTAATAGEFTVDLTSLSFTDTVPGLSVTNRANAMKGRGLETSTFPTATFKITEPVAFGERPADGETVTASVTGDLTLHGVTKEITFDVEAKLVGDTIRVATKDPVPVVLADYDITKPEGGPIASISDEGSFEFLVVFDAP